ncbi:MAG: hypothetical protein Q4C99_07895 [Clostridia bacterium]|nr:hypothetical protein [Clostridia bacterium]
MFFLQNETDIGELFGVKLISSTEMDSAVKVWHNISIGRPPWLNSSDGIETVNMAKHISDTRAKLDVLDIGVAISGSARADYLQMIADDLLKQIPDRVADAARRGGMIIKFNGESWDFVLPGEFGVTEVDNNGKIRGAIFASHKTQGSAHFTRLEYHRFDGKNADGGLIYKITNRVFLNKTGVSGVLTLGKEVDIKTVEAWAKIAPEVSIVNLNEPLFGFFRMPGSNTIDPTSPLGLSVFANALTELKAIDIAISRKNLEVEDSKHITFVGETVIRSAQNQGFELPRFVRGLGIGIKDGETTAIHEHVPTMLTDQRIKDINFNLSMAGVKCGFSEGVFVLDGQTGMITATQVESDDRDTIQTIKTDRDALRDALEQAIAGANAIATLYNLAPLGEYEINFNFGDITYNYEEDKSAWKYYVSQGWVPKWMYLVKFEGMSEEEAKAITAEADAANAQKATLFGVE